MEIKRTGKTKDLKEPNDWKKKGLYMTLTPNCCSALFIYDKLLKRKIIIITVKHSKSIMFNKVRKDNK